MSSPPTSPASRSSPTSASSHETPPTRPTCSAEASRARISASQGDAAASPASDPACSTSSPASPTLFDHAGSCSRTSPASYRRTAGETWESLSVLWPTSGMASGGEFSTHATSECPSDAAECSLSEILEATVDPRFDVSARAATGILRRSTVRGRRLPDVLVRGLEATASRSPSPDDTQGRTPAATASTTSSCPPSRPPEETEDGASMPRLPLGDTW